MGFQDVDWLTAEREEPCGVHLHVPDDDRAQVVARNDVVGTKATPASRVYFATLKHEKTGKF